jgi:hypothetical protein
MSAPKRRAWTVLIHSLPPTPPYLRAKVRNRLRKAGAAALKDSVYVLPADRRSREELRSVAAEAVAGGGEAFVCEARFDDPEVDERLSRELEPTGDPSLLGRVWTTRRGVQIDRIASAWLIRRFLDPKARFRFVEPGAERESGELRFDMPGGDFTHEGDNCTFETLLGRVAAPDRALREIAEVVHAIDIKDGKFDRPDAAGIERVVQGIVLESADDEERLRRGSALFDGLLASYGRRPKS